MDQTFDIFITELVNDDELREAFLRNPRRTLARADEWGLPFCDSEIQSLLANQRAIWNRLADMMDDDQERAA